MPIRLAIITTRESNNVINTVAYFKTHPLIKVNVIFTPPGNKDKWSGLVLKMNETLQIDYLSPNFENIEELLIKHKIDYLIVIDYGRKNDFKDLIVHAKNKKSCNIIHILLAPNISYYNDYQHINTETIYKKTIEDKTREAGVIFYYIQNDLIHEKDILFQKTVTIGQEEKLTQTRLAEVTESLVKKYLPIQLEETLLKQYGVLFKIWEQKNILKLDDVFISYPDKDYKPIEQLNSEPYNGLGKWFTYTISDKHIAVKTFLFPTKLKEYNSSPKFNQIKDDNKLNVVHTYAVARITLTMFLRAFERIDNNAYSWKNFKWVNTKTPLLINIDDSIYRNHGGQYTPSAHIIRLGLNGDGEPICRSFDVVSHEVGHAIFINLTKMNEKLEFSPAFHESFADISTIFSLLSMLNVCQKLIIETKGFLGSEEDFLRFFDDTRDYKSIEKEKEASAEPHSASMKITKTMFDIIVQTFFKYKNIEKYDPAESLYKTGKMLLDFYLAAVIYLINPSEEAGLENCCVDCFCNTVPKKEKDYTLNELSLILFKKMCKDICIKAKGLEELEGNSNIPPILKNELSDKKQLLKELKDIVKDKISLIEKETETHTREEYEVQLGGA